MTTFIARHGARTAHSSAGFHSAKERLLRSLDTLGNIVADSVQAARALEHAHTPAERRAAVHGLATHTSRDAGRSAP